MREIIEKITFALLKANMKQDPLGCRAETAELEEVEHSKAVRAFMHDLFVDYMDANEEDFEILESEIRKNIRLQHEE